MRLALLLPLLLLACATGRRGPAELSFPPDELTVTAADVELAEKNDEELFAIGTAAAAAGDDARAARAFGRLADLHPSSPRRSAALREAGLAHARREEWGAALGRFEPLAGGAGADAIAASFRVAEAQYQLGDGDAARATLTALAARPEVSAADRGRALTERGVVELELGRADEAEGTLQLALAAFEAARQVERLEPYSPSQARFFLGEVERARFLAAPLDPSRGDGDALARGLEAKAQLLLSAQERYLEAIRVGEERWAVASGYRIGELYESLRRALLDAPLPPGLDEEGARLYREELGREVRVLAAKAIGAYEQTLALAERAGVTDVRFLDDMRAARAALEQALRDTR
jgi:hypothetical protein